MPSEKTWQQWLERLCNPTLRTGMIHDRFTVPIAKHGTAILFDLFVPNFYYVQNINEICMRPPPHALTAPLAGWLVCVMLTGVVAILGGCAAAQQGAMNIADERLAKHDYSGALAKLNEGEHYTKPSSNLQAWITFQRGVCYQGLGMYADARGSFQFVTNRFPETEYAEISRQRLADLPRSEAYQFVANLESGSPLENYDSLAVVAVRKKWWNQIGKNGIKVKKSQVVKVTFKIFADGRIADLKIIDPKLSNGVLEELATKAITDSAPFPEVPPALRHIVPEPRPFTLTFKYYP